ncbi:XRE family transcriptional regulator [Novosphingobium barchaimii]|nr:XRE family transcriptional regulator [Novosphingobium barchaimii]
MPAYRTFAGSSLRAIRTLRRLRQAEMAQTLGISAAYLSQLENDDRPLTAALIDKLERHFPSEWRGAPRAQAEPLHVALHHAMASSGMSGDLSSSKIRRIAEQHPEFAARFIDLERSAKQSLQRLAMLDEALGVGNLAGGRLPWEEVRDWFSDSDNYVDTIDRAAEAFSGQLSGEAVTPSIQTLTQWLDQRGVDVRFASHGPLRHFNEVARTLTVNSAQAQDSLRFHLAWHVASIVFREEIAAIIANAVVTSDTSRNLLSIGLGNYAAGAILMPYGAFRLIARDYRHDIDRLRHAFGTTFEQVCHRLSTLQRPGELGIPMYFCRVDIAGNITKRHSATRLRFARFGGACPLWVVHEAVAVPDRIHVQLAEMPDGVRYVSIAKGLVKQGGNYTQRPHRHAVALGCETDYADAFIYADELNLSSSFSATKIGTSCRICPRTDCSQRAFPPSDREISVDVNRRDIVPYEIGG